MRCRNMTASSSRKANVAQERSTSLWMSAPINAGGREDMSGLADLLVVVGGGMAGLSIAYEAAVKGRQVLVLDRGAIASGMTARTTAHLASALDDYYCEFISLRGEREAALLHQSLAAAIDRIEQIARLETIDCDFARLDGYLFAARPEDQKLLAREYDACRAIGCPVEWAERMPGFDAGRALRFPNQGRFHPLKYLSGLAQALLRLGVRFRPFTAVSTVEQKEDRVLVTLTSGEVIQARDAAVATNSPIAGRLTLQAKMAPYRSYAMAFAVPKGAVPDALYWDTLEAYHYVRLQPGEDEDWLIVGGEDHKTGEADDAPRRFGALETWARARFAGLGEVTHRWSGQVLEPVDYAGFVGRDPDNDHIYFVTGDSGQGITNGAVGGLLIATLLEDEDHPWRKLYDPARVSPKAAGTFVSENATAVKGLAEHLGGGVLASEADLGKEQGGLLQQGLAKVGVYRDADGAVHRVSATCTHVGCVVHFNSFERCWDCPCHGSHFGIDGEVLNAPATVPLKPIA
jgi:glycine/D-amino acid oxidase-like deaminating enzyme/nitrite reductase/ring-hydroxylating ferredoxin subunit